MKKVLSFCVLSVLLSVLSLGLKAQSGLVLDPANMPEVVLEQYDTIYLSPNSACFDALGLSDTSHISIEWQVLYNGSVIPNDSLSFYFEEFKFESRYNLGNAEKWWGRTYTSSYCQNGNGYGSYPGANTPTANLGQGQQCEDPGHFIVSLPGQNNQYQFDYFYVRWFKDATHTAHRLVYSIIKDGDYQIVFSLAKRCGGTKWDAIYEANDERYYVGGHHSVECGILSSDTLHDAVISDITDYFRCVGDSLVIGNPAQTFTVSTDTTIDPGYDSVFYMGASSCNGAIDSIVRFRVFFEDPSVPVLDTLNSTLAICDSGQISIRVNLTAADKCIWLDETNTVIDTLDATTAFTDTINANATYHVLGFNSASGCVSSDTLTVYAEVFASPNPVVTATPDTLCENGTLKITLDQEYDKWTWFHDGTNMNLDTIVYDVANVATTDAGWYLAEVSVNHVHSVYTTVDTVACSAADSAQVVVFTRPRVDWATLDGVAVVDSTVFCPNDLEHVIVATISGGQAPYDNIHWTGTAGTETYNADKSSDTLTLTLANTCGTAYSVGIDYAVDSNGCTLKDTIEVTFFVNDTIAPTITKTKDTVSAPAYAGCEYIIPNVNGIITTSDNCGIADTTQVPAAGAHVTTDTIVIVTITDLCGNTASDTIEVSLPVDELVIDTIEVTATVLCAGDANGAIRITVKDGTAPYDVRITHHTVTDSVYTQHGNGPVFDFDGLIAGKWDIQVTDTNGCQVVVNDTADVAAPDILTLTTSNWTDLTCFESNDGSFKFNVTQGTTPYDVKIVRTLGAVRDSVEMSLNPATLDTIVTMENQKAGIYVISVVDGHGCTASATDTINQPDQLVLVGDTVLAHVLCFGDSIGNLAVTGVTGGTYPYSYAWLNAANDTVSTDSVTGAILPAGIYTIYVTDAHGCTADRTLTDTIKQPDGPLTLTSENWTNLTCFESNNGSFDFKVKDGTKPYTVKINRTFGTDVEDSTMTLNPTGVDTTVHMINMKAGIYVISVEDANGCVADTITDTITQPDQLILLGDTILNHVKCFGDANGNLAVTGVTGGTTPYVFEWRYAANDSVVSHDSVTGRILPIGTYTIYLTDANNCPPSDTLSSTILGPDTLEVLSLVAPVNDTCPHLGNYEFTAEVQGGRTDYNFQWKFNTVEVRTYTTSALKDTFVYNETVVSCDTTFDIVFTVTDDSACTASMNITFTISDTINPTLSGTIDTVTMDGCVAADAPDTLNTIAKLLAAGLTISDNCTPTDSLIVNYTEVVTGTCPIEIVRTYSVTDKCGRTSDEITQVFYVQDTTKPVFTTLPVTDTVSCNGSGNIYEFNTFITKNQTNVAATDNCGTVNITMAPYDTIIGCNSAAKTYVYSFTATDACGNETVEYASFIIIDTAAPTIVPAPDVVMECSIDDLDTIRAHSLALFTYDDACAHNATFVSDSLSEWTKVCGPAGYYTHYVTVTDSCQTTTASHLISIVDTKEPVFTTPPTSNPVVECDGSGNLSDLYDWLYGVVAYDSCSGPVDSIAIFFVDPLDGSHLIPFDSAVARDADGHFAAAWVSEGSCNGYYRFHWEATDSCGNTVSTTEDFRIKDRKGPVFSETRTDTTVNCDYDPASFTAWLTLQKAYDVCSRDSIPVTYTTNFIPSCGSTGVYQVEWKSKDLCDSTTHNANWFIIDTVAPVVETYYGGLLKTDTIYFDPNPPYNAPFPDASWDKTNLTESQSATFMYNFLHEGTLQDNYGNPHIIKSSAGFSNVIECGYVKEFHFVNHNPSPSVDGECVINLLVEYVFVDACGNDFSISQTVVVMDTSAPAVKNISDIKYFKGPDSPDSACMKEIVPEFTTVSQLAGYVPTNSARATPTDQNLNPGSITLDTIIYDYSSSAPCDSIEIRHYTLTDDCGNSRTFTHTIVFKDSMPPQLNITVMTDSIHQMAYPNCGKYSEIEVGHLYDSLKSETWLNSRYGLVISDCHAHTINFVSETEEQDNNFCPGKVFVRKYEVVKDCYYYPAIKSYFNVRLVVKDTIAPQLAVANLTPDTVYSTNPDECGYTVPNVHFTDYTQLETWQGATVANDCNLGTSNNVTMIDSVIVGSGCTFDINYRYTVEDSCGNVSDTIHLTITVMDTLAPMVTTAHATLVDTQYYNTDCTLPVLNKWTTPQDALDHGVVFKDCNPAWSDASKLVLLDSVSVRNVCTIEYTVAYQVKDACTDHLSDTIYQSIVILDTVAPVVTPEILDTLVTYMIDDAGDCWGNPVAYFHTVADVKAYDTDFDVVDCNVGDDSEVKLVSEDSSAVTCTRIVLRNYVVKDSCGLVSNVFTQTIFVRDTSAPVITATLTPDTVYMDQACDYTYRTFATVSALPAYMQAGISDCNLKDALEFVSADTLATGSVECYKAYTVVVKYNVQDFCEHKTALYDTIYIADTIAPAISGHLDTVTVYTEEVGCGYTIPAALTYASTDDLPTAVTITDCKLRKELTVSAIDTVTGYCPMLIHRTYTVKDSCGHESYFDQFFEVRDTFAPKATSYTLTNDTVFITETGTYAADPAFTTVAQLNAHGTTITDCNLVNEINSCNADTTIDHTVCADNYITRKYTVTDSCSNISDTIVHKIVLRDTVKPYMENMPDTVWAVFVDPCTFQVPDLRDTVANHYHDNWTTPYDASYFVSQVPAAGTDLVNPRDTFVVVTFKDACDNVNTDTVRIINWADTEAPTTGLNGATIDAYFAGSCTFEVPALEDTIKNHYNDNWNTFYSTGSYNSALYEQIPATYTFTNFTDTVVTVIYGDKCGNKDTVKITINVPDSLYISSISMTEPNCFGLSDGTIPVQVTGGAADYTYSYSGGSIVTSLTDTVFHDVAANTYLVTVTDGHGCTDTATIVVTQPTEVSLTPVVLNPTNCLSGTGADTTEVGIVMAGGVANYNVMAILLADDKTTVVDTLLNVTGIADASDTVAIDPTPGDFYVAFYGEDSHGCPKFDTSAMISVYPVYLFEQTGRVCSNTEYKWGRAPGDTITYPAGYFAVSDTTYILTYETFTSHGCDSIYTLSLRVEDIPYLRVRSLADASADLSNAIEQTIYDTFNVASTNVGWEIFIDKNCMTCDGTAPIKDPVSIEYDLYRYNDVTDSYELMPNVTTYFLPYYRTFMDNYELAYTPYNSGHVSIPKIYVPQTMGTNWNFDFFNLCWFAPDYDETHLPAGYEHTGSGDYYKDARANIINISSFVEEGDYLIVATLYTRTGSTMNPSMNYSWNLALNQPIGGNSSVLGEPLGVPTEIYFHVDAASSPVIHMPTTDPIGGDVIYTTHKDVDAEANVYPNPARDYVQVELTGFEGQTEVVLSSTGGKVLKTIKLDVMDKKSTPIIRIETGDYAQGVYMITARNKETIITKRVVIIK